MKQYLQSLGIPELDQGHEMMARICFQQIRCLGPAIIVQPWYRFREWFTLRREWPLITYVVKYWSCHYRLATKSGSVLSVELYHLLTAALLGSDPSSSSVLLHRRVVDIGGRISRIYNLPDLAALFESMGASAEGIADALLDKPPSVLEWQHMQITFGLVSMEHLECDESEWFSKLASNWNLMKLRKHQSNGIATRLQDLHLRAAETCSGHTWVDAALLPSSESATGFEDWVFVTNASDDSDSDSDSVEGFVSL
ncbi:hypothetical protein H2198_007155 [Neophaeococcomyces mojaviensis]|uniref:Uncharacterized protein n=1 Tax=Neophaeococcomyces mojaviensis TaxID=3383035 RepID=A0ACC3A191_9EURO|nr:hypothetical protein H2198_007155 [Knufia sp. JES_112]